MLGPYVPLCCLAITRQECSRQENQVITDLTMETGHFDEVYIAY